MILGLGGSSHDTSFCLFRNGEIKCAIEEERISREKHALGRRSIAMKGIKYCLNHVHLNEDKLDLIVANDLFPGGVFAGNTLNSKYIRINHHMSHAASSYFLSPFQESAILVVDGVGTCFSGIHYETISLGYAEGNDINFFKKIYGLPFNFKIKKLIKKENNSFSDVVIKNHTNSFGELYSALSQICGFEFLQEGKLMGLASYGKNSVYIDVIRHAVEINLPQSIKIRFNEENMQELMDAVLFDKRDLFNIRADLAFAVQHITENVTYEILNHLYEKTQCKNLCLSGGFALNSVLNGKIKDRTKFENIYIMCAPGDNGTAIGAALYGYHVIQKNPRKIEKTTPSPFLGLQYEEKYILSVLERNRDLLKYDLLEDSELYDRVANLISQGKIIGWFQGKSEFGPRALGNRSILADPRIEEMKDILNSRVKFREHFRPFAPIVLSEHTNEYFKTDFEDNPYMLFVGLVKENKKKIIPAVTHVDGSARLQTVSKSFNNRLYKLLQSFYKQTNVPVLLNTSFNIKGEPIVETPQDAIKAFINCDMDYLIIHNWLIQKNKCT